VEAPAGVAVAACLPERLPVCLPEKQTLCLQGLVSLCCAGSLPLTWKATSNCSQGTGSASGHALQAAISL
jgi:hypothetical protein